MKLLTKAQRNKLLKNGQAQLDSFTTGVVPTGTMPVVKLFNPGGAATWLISEIDPEDNDTCFGLADLGMGFAELGSFSLREIESLRGQFGRPMERDRHWEPTKTLAEYAEEARAAGRIVA